jgi:rod shape-determining protein MreD
MMAAAGTTPRFVVLIVTVILLQVSVASHLVVFGSVVNLWLVLIVTTGLMGGPDMGAMVGFCAGLAADLVVQTPFGMWAVCGTLIGYGAGTLAARVSEGNRLVRSLVVGFTAATGIGLFVSLGWLIGQTQITDRPVASIMVVVGLSASALAPVAERVVRWGLLMRVNVVAL